MPTASLISVEEYLKTSYHPDREYLDGEVVERKLGEREHSFTQGEILFYLRSRYSHLRGRIFLEQRVQVTTSRFRVPDVCVLGEGAPWEKIVRTPPVLCVEILSPEDTLPRLMERVKDYFEMGVRFCWVIDPIDRQAWNATPAGSLTKAEDGILRAERIEMPLAEVLE